MRNERTCLRLEISRPFSFSTTNELLVQRKFRAPDQAGSMRYGGACIDSTAIHNIVMISNRGFASFNTFVIVLGTARRPNGTNWRPTPSTNLRNH